LNSFRVSGNSDGIERFLRILGERSIVDEPSHPFAVLLGGSDNLFDGRLEDGFVATRGDVSEQGLCEIVGPDEDEICRM
jgi:hypothetical protein